MRHKTTGPSLHSVAVAARCRPRRCPPTLFDATATSADASQQSMYKNKMPVAPSIVADRHHQLVQPANDKSPRLSKHERIVAANNIVCP